jgi:hypothetical protein
MRLLLTTGPWLRARRPASEPRIDRRRGKYPDRRAFGISAVLLVILVVRLIDCATCSAASSQSASSDTEGSSENHGNPTGSPFGVNLDGLFDWSRTWMFVDAFKQSRPWSPGRLGSGSPPPGEPLSIDAHGTLTSLQAGQSAVTYIFTGSEGHYPAGPYLARYDGEGQLNWRGDATVLSSSPGEILLDVRPRRGVHLAVTRTNPADPIRNIRLYMPGFHSEKERPRFHPIFIERLRPFSTLRFMDLQRTNNSVLSRWSQRPTPEDSTQAGAKGVALEHLMELVRELDVDPWFCMPHMADDHFVRRFAELVRKTLPADRKVYIEYSNEVWNSMFEQARFAREKGLALGLSKNEQEAQLRFYAQRSIEIFRIWEDVFGGHERLTRVLSSHFANPWAIETTLSWRDAYQAADALALAPYFGRRFGGPEAAPKIDGWGPERLLDALEDEVTELLPKIRLAAHAAQSRGMELLAYEAGQHLAGRGGRQNDAALTSLFLATNRHPRMKPLYQRYLRGWQRNGGGLMMLFSFVSKPSKWGSWGLLEWQDQPRMQAPKWDAVLELVSEASSRH